MRIPLAALLLLAGCATPPAPVPATQPAASAASPVAAAPDQVWRGTLRCQPIPGVVTFRLAQPIEVDVRGGVASYERTVRRGDTGGESDVHERGQGQVGPDGAVTLIGSAQSPQYQYTARYSGVLPPQGGRTTLTGAQSWHLRTASPPDRACTMTLRR